MDRCESFQLTVTLLIQAMVRKPKAVSVTLSDDGQRINLRIIVHPDDVGLVLGKGGRTIRAIRTIALAVGPHIERVITLELPENPAGRPKGIEEPS